MLSYSPDEVGAFQAIFTGIEPADNAGTRFASSQAFAISNDEAFTELAPVLEARKKDRRGGIGLFIGSGGLLSMLPELGLDIAVTVDINQAILDFNRRLAEAVRDSESTAALLDMPSRMPDPRFSDDFEEFDKLMEDAGVTRRKPTPVSEEIEKEAEEYGKYHWTQPSRLDSVRRALADTALLWVYSDVTSEDFKASINELASTTDQEITFANLTNVHRWLKFQCSMDFLREWPFAEHAQILFSRFEGRKFLRMECAESLEDYVETANNDQQR
jgi:hypothetical protein